MLPYYFLKQVSILSLKIHDLSVFMWKSKDRVYENVELMP